ncbi:MAG: hypothetical protein PHX30_00465 [Candidatus Pacebacteria bacterium]|jgi:hypothetical protein|nr:hypothetical protein [Candidatus Paceibacterota bacterium]
MQSYIIRKSPGLHQEHREVARLTVDDEGKVLYDLIILDNDVERVLSQAQIAGGLYCLVPFREEKNGAVILGQKEIFVKTTDADFMEAIEFNLKSGLVDRD